jgi:UDP-N-acetylglucosamine--N-acetylmuramyl-(pentapeptide) pyrophosphoryl-undecaprenol N-acetylglucosamine transferase
MSTDKKRLLIMAAGTGGHIFPGLAIAELMKARGWNVSWLGTSAGMESDIVPARGIDLDKLDFTGMRGKGWKHTLSGAWKLLRSLYTCWGIIGKRKPDVVIGMGGYVTVPGGLIAWLRRKPVVLMNADAALLLSNHALLPFSARLMFGLPPDTVLKDKMVWTGNPIRHDICMLPSPDLRYEKRQGKLRILVVGGSLGAKVLNDTIPAALALIPEDQRPHVTHQSGKQNIAALRENYQRAGIEAEVVDFIDDMAVRYAETDLVICRAGAITISELTAAGVASLLVPFMASSTSHQKQNAVWMAAKQAALYVPQTELTPESLAKTIQELNRKQCSELAITAYALGRREASENIARILEELA